MFTLPTDFVSNISANATDAIASLSPYITLILGVSLAILVITALIHAIKR